MTQPVDMISFAWVSPIRVEPVVKLQSAFDTEDIATMSAPSIFEGVGDV
jgi:hypothetical protein